MLQIVGNYLDLCMELKPSVDKQAGRYRMIGLFRIGHRRCGLYSFQGLSFEFASPIPFIQVGVYDVSHCSGHKDGPCEDFTGRIGSKTKALINILAHLVPSFDTRVNLEGVVNSTTVYLLS